MNLKNRSSWCIVPSLSGVIVFFIFPFFRVLYYSVINNQFQREWVGFSNYQHLFRNKYFLLALKNTMLQIGICVPVLLMISVLISIAIAYGSESVKAAKLAFILPMVIPTAGVILVWRDFFSQFDNVIPIYLLYVWKNMGICIILISAALKSIPETVYEAGKLDGAGFINIHRYITIPLVMPVVIFCSLLSIVNVFRIFKESYLYFETNYPPDYGYSLQYYLNNNFLKLDYQALASSAVSTTALILFIVLLEFKMQKRWEI